MAKGRLAIIGTGPAGLMAASAASQAAPGLEILLFEKKKGPGRKLLVAGSSGLNITYESPLPEFARFYGASQERMRPYLEGFPPTAWRSFIEDLGIPTFLGTSRRYFVEGLKGAPLLRAWLNRLAAAPTPVSLRTATECIGFEPVSPRGVQLQFSDGSRVEADAVVFALGGGSWEPTEKPLRWPAIFRAKGLGFREFEASNVGFQVAWPEAFREEAEGKPIKNIVLESPRGRRAGDLVVTRYGIEGTPVYFAGEVGTVFLDLKPDLSEARVLAKLQSVRENLSPIRRVKRFLNLSPAAFALVFHLTPKGELADAHQLAALARRIKRFPLELGARQPLDEAISSSGGVHWDELDASLMLRKFPGVFLAGEMIDWEAPTGGFLIQGCVSQGHAAGLGAVEWLRRGSAEV